MRTALATIALLFACGSPSANDTAFADWAAQLSARDEQGQPWHQGPEVHVDKTGTARFAEKVRDAFRLESAMELVRYVDGFYRAPANEGYDAVLARLEEFLRESGFGGDDVRFELAVWETPRRAPAWTPRRAQVLLVAPGEEPRLLHSFRTPSDVDRVVLPINAPACDVQGRVATSLDDLESGMVLVTEVPLLQVLERARFFGAAAVLSASLETFNVDPQPGGERHLDAILFDTVPPGTTLPVGRISPRSFAAIRAASEENPQVSVAFRSEVDLEQDAPLRTLVATIVGADAPQEAVVVVAHVQEPGACDNASGVGGLAEGAATLARLVRDERIARPARSIAFVWGDEFVQSEVWLERSGRRAVAGISADMIGESPERTGAIALLERMPDPGAVRPLPPDEHTPWGAGEVEQEHVVPSGLAIVARCALADVALLEKELWRTADHPWEGGSDHDVFIARGIPGVLFWHFTDFSYHTSLDRLPMVDADELARTTTAILATALAVADPLATDLERYLRSLAKEQSVRIRAAEEANDAALVQAWTEWFLGAREWLRAECLPGLEHGEQPLPRPADDGERSDSSNGEGSD